MVIAKNPTLNSPSNLSRPCQDHEVELAVAIIDKVTSIATIVKEGVLFPVFLVGLVVGHQLLNPFDIDTFAIETIGTQLGVQFFDKVMEGLGNRDRTFVTGGDGGGSGAVDLELDRIGWKGSAG